MDRAERTAELRRLGFAKPTKGMCYQQAGRYAMDHADEPGLTLVHGTVSGQGPLKGVRFGHAWIERGDTVVETTLGDKEIPKDLYYAIGEVSDAAAYTPREAMVLMLRTKHWGPWE